MTCSSKLLSPSLAPPKVLPNLGYTRLSLSFFMIPPNIRWENCTCLVFLRYTHLPVLLQDYSIFLPSCVELNFKSRFCKYMNISCIVWSCWMSSLIFFFFLRWCLVATNSFVSSIGERRFSMVNVEQAIQEIFQAHDIQVSLNCNMLIYFFRRKNPPKRCHFVNNVIFPLFYHFIYVMYFILFRKMKGCQIVMKN